MDDLFSIGEFSRITGLTVKALRFYHDEGLLAPSCVDDETGYRYYHPRLVERAGVIARLRALEFSLAEISAMLRDCGEDEDMVSHLERRLESVDEEILRSRKLRGELQELIATTRQRRAARRDATPAIEEKTIEPQLAACVRMKGKYRECGKAFGKIGRRFGRHICGPPLLLIYDEEYREEDADFEAAMPIRKGTSGDGIEVRELPGGTALTLIHEGPYDECGPTYERLFSEMKRRGLTPAVPCREVYLKGPGMIFKGNPRRYVTEIQVFIGGTTR